MTEPDEQPSPANSKSDNGMLSRIELRLKVHKLRLERTALQRQLSKPGRALEWVKAAATPVALISILTTFFVGFKQIRELQKTRDNERIEKALERLASEKEADRLTGVSVLRLFLNPLQKDQHITALYFLVNAAALEKSAVVQNAILDTFNSITGDEIEISVLDTTLKTAIERNRSLTAKLRASNEARFKEQEENLLKHFPKVSVQNPSNPNGDPLTDSQRREDLSLDRLPFANITDEEMLPLRSLSNIITALLKTGATGQNFSDLYCERCNFSNLGLNKTDFSHSYLWGSNFAFSRLAQSNFERADLGAVNFYHADLKNADLKGSSSDLGLDRTSPYHSVIDVPTLECADLRGTNLSERVLGWLDDIYEDPQRGVRIVSLWIPNFNHVVVDSSTKVEPFGIAWSVDIVDEISLQVGWQLNNQTEAVWGTSSVISVRRFENSVGHWKTRFTRFGGITHDLPSSNVASTGLKLIKHALSYGEWRRVTLPKFLNPDSSHSSVELPSAPTMNGEDKTCVSVEAHQENSNMTTRFSMDWRSEFR